VTTGLESRPKALDFPQWLTAGSCTNAINQNLIFSHILISGGRRRRLQVWKTHARGLAPVDAIGGVVRFRPSASVLKAGIVLSLLISFSDACLARVMQYEFLSLRLKGIFHAMRLGWHCSSRYGVSEYGSEDDGLERGAVSQIRGRADPGGA
jgi:hypothetical protein